MGLLASSFLPNQTTEELRTFCRQRTNVKDLAAQASYKMQKYLKLLNFRLDVVVNDICGLTGLAIIADICKGNLEPISLAKHRRSLEPKGAKSELVALRGIG